MRATLKQGLLQFSIVSATTAIALTTTTNAWSANLTFASSRDALSANDFVDWSNPITQVTNANNGPATFTTLSAGGITVTGSQAGDFGEIRRQNSTPYPDEASLPGSATANTTFWNGNFAPGAAVYWNKGSANGSTGLTLSFATPVYAVGAQLNSLFYHGSGTVGVTPFRGTITAFYGNGSTASSRTVDLNGTTSALANNSATFYGFTSDAADITRVVFNTTDITNNDGYNFAINRVSLRTTSSVQAVPEPFSIVGTLIGGAAALKLRKRLKVTNKL